MRKKDLTPIIPVVLQSYYFKLFDLNKCRQFIIFTTLLARELKCKSVANVVNIYSVNRQQPIHFE